MEENAAEQKNTQENDIAERVKLRFEGTLDALICEELKNKETALLYKELIEELDAVFARIPKGTLTGSRPINNVAAKLIQSLNWHKDSYIPFILDGKVWEQELAKSAVNCAIMSAVTAKELKLGNRKIMQIVIGALLHDVGVLMLPKAIFEKKGGLSNTELAMMKSHPDFAAKFVIKDLAYPNEISYVVKEHHERWDGKGYPDGIAGGVIDIGARIVSVADAFEAMVSNKPYRPSMSSFEAMKNLLAENSLRFDPYVINAFSKIMGIYPVGSIVLLNNGAYGRVTKIRQDVSTRPKIKILVNASGKTLDPNQDEEIDLLFDKKLYIVKGIDPKEFAQRNA